MRTVKCLLAVFIGCLFLSGVTVFPLDWELRVVASLFAKDSVIYDWFSTVRIAYEHVESTYPFLLYGYDWLAFAHIVLAILFIGPYRNPVKNMWVIQFGLIACVLVIPLALIAGPQHSIPFGWRCIDMAFGVVGFFVLSIVQIKLRHLQDQQPPPLVPGARSYSEEPAR